MDVFYFHVLVFTLFGLISPVVSNSASSKNVPGSAFFFASPPLSWGSSQRWPLSVSGNCHIFGTLETELKMEQRADHSVFFGGGDLGIGIIDGLGSVLSNNPVYNGFLDDNSKEKITNQINDMLLSNNFTVTSGALFTWKGITEDFKDWTFFRQLVIACDSTLNKTYAIANYNPDDSDPATFFTTLKHYIIGGFIRLPGVTIDFPHSYQKAFFDEIACGNTGYAHHLIIDITDEQPNFNFFKVPLVMLINGRPVEEGRIDYVAPGDSLTVECRMDGRSPSYVTLSLALSTDENTTDTESSVSISVVAGTDVPQPVCSVVHANACFNKTISGTIESSHGPTSVTPGPPGFENQAERSETSPTIQMTCEVAKTDVNPIPKVTLQVQDGSLMTFEPNNTYESELVFGYNFTFSPTTRGLLSGSCVANNTETNVVVTGDFELSVYDPSFINSFTVNSVAGPVEVEDGTNVTLACVAEGIPVPNVKLSDSEGQIDGNQTPLDDRSVKIELTKSMDCSDVIVCESSSLGHKSYSSLNVTVKGAMRLAGLNEDLFKTAANGLSQPKFTVCADRKPLKIRVFRSQGLAGPSNGKRRSTSGSREEIDSKNYIYTFRQVNAKYGEIVLDLFDLFTKDGQRYILEVYSEVGVPLAIDFSLALTEENSASGLPKDSDQTKSALALIAVCVVFVFFLIIDGIAIIAFVYWIKQHSKMLKERRSRRETARGARPPRHQESRHK